MKKKTKQELRFRLEEAGTIEEANAKIHELGQEGYFPLRVEVHATEFFLIYTILFADFEFIYFKNHYGVEME